MKTINIAPTWGWVAKMYLWMRTDPKNAKATRGFRAELERLGKPMQVALKAIIRIAMSADKDSE